MTYHIGQKFKFKNRYRETIYTLKSVPNSSNKVYFEDCDGNVFCGADPAITVNNVMAIEDWEMNYLLWVHRENFVLINED